MSLKVCSLLYTTLFLLKRVSWSIFPSASASGVAPVPTLKAKAFLEVPMSRGHWGHMITAGTRVYFSAPKLAQKQVVLPRMGAETWQTLIRE